MKKSAVISECGKFRYALGRTWDSHKPALGFIMLNPSTADADQDDPTIRKCIGFAERLGYGAIVVTNLYAYRATDPVELKRAGYLRGPENDAWITKALREVEFTICAWGANARGMSRPVEVMEMVEERHGVCTALALTDDGIPRHPLMLPYTCTLTEFA